MQNKFYFTGSFSNIYKKSSKFSEVTSQILYGEKFKILSKTKNWIKIKSSFDNYTGYIQNKNYSKDDNQNEFLKLILELRKKERDNNYGSEIMKASILAISEKMKEKKIKISAQTYLKIFYNNLGFLESGKEYLEDGIPHVAMFKK